MSAAQKCGLCAARIQPGAPVCPVCGDLGRCPCGRVADLVRADNQRRCWRCDEGRGKRRHGAGGEP